MQSSGNIIFTTGKNGSIIWKLCDGTEILCFAPDGASILGVAVPYDEIRNWLLNKKNISNECKCSIQQLVKNGCICGGD